MAMDPARASPQGSPSQTGNLGSRWRERASDSLVLSLDRGSSLNPCCLTTALAEVKQP